MAHDSESFAIVPDKGRKETAGSYLLTRQQCPSSGRRSGELLMGRGLLGTSLASAGLGI